MGVKKNKEKKNQHFQEDIWAQISNAGCIQKAYNIH